MERLNPIAVLVKNEPGVLARVAGLFTRRGFNIISLAVGETEDPNVSRMSVVVSGDDAVREQVIKQLRRLVDVHRVDDLTYQPRVERGLALIKVKAPPEKRGEIVELANIFRAAITHVDPRTMVVEVSGNANKIDAMLDMMRPFGILEMARTGQIVMARGRRALPGQEQMHGQTPDQFYETDHGPLGFDDPEGSDQTNLLRLK
jgi:acetolactate synthase-1/3 small subunit